MKKQLTAVKAFHEAFDVPILNQAQIPNKERAELRIKLLEEELDELKEAVAENDLTETADALVDLQYVLLGTLLEFGMQDKFESCFEEVHRSNMSKLDSNGKAIYREDGKVIKSERYSPPNLKPLLKP